MEYNCTASWIFRAWLITSVLLAIVVMVQVYQHLIAIALLFIGYRVLAKTLSRCVQPNGRGVFITGCDTGMGHAQAIRLSERGFTVFAGCLQTYGAGAKALQQTTDGRIHVVELDVTKQTSIDAAVAFVKEKLPESGLWAVINNAGIKRVGYVEIARLEMIKQVLEVNYFGMIRVTKAFLPMIRKNKGRIINVTSVKGRMAVPTDAAYISSKWAAEAFSECLRREMLRFGVKVIVMEPGDFRAVTNVARGENFKLIESELFEAWDSASVEVQQAYGRESVDNLREGVLSGGQAGAKNLDSIVNAMQDAVEKENPSYRYLVHGAWLLDKYCIVARLQELLPEFVMDFLILRLPN